MPFIVIVDRPYYPQVKEVNTMEEAVTLKDKWIGEHQALDGDMTAKIYIADVIQTKEFPTDH